MLVIPKNKVEAARYLTFHTGQSVGQYREWAAHLSAQGMTQTAFDRILNSVEMDNFFRLQIRPGGQTYLFSCDGLVATRKLALEKCSLFKIDNARYIIEEYKSNRLEKGRIYMDLGGKLQIDLIVSFYE